MKATERALMYLFECLCALCAVATVLALADGSPWWSWTFAVCSLLSFEASGELGQS